MFVMNEMEDNKEILSQKPFDLLSKFNHLRCWESRCRFGERSMVDWNTQRGGHCQRNLGVLEGKGTIAAAFRTSAETELRCNCKSEGMPFGAGAPTLAPGATYIYIYYHTNLLKGVDLRGD